MSCALYALQEPGQSEKEKTFLGDTALPVSSFKIQNEVTAVVSDTNCYGINKGN